MGLKSKEINIFRMLTRESYTVRELARENELSERNLRYSLENLEYYLKKIVGKEIDKKNKRLSVLITDEEAEAFLCSIRSEYIYSNEERREYLLNYFLFSEEPKIKEAEEVLGVTRTTLKKDIAALEEELRYYSLEFQLVGNKLVIEGNEKKLRNLLMLKMERYLKGREVAYPLGEILGKLLEERYDLWKGRAREVFEGIEDGMDYHYSPEFRGLMEYYLGATFMRVAKGRYILRKHNEDFLRKTHEYEVIRGLKIGEIPSEMDYELLHLTEYFISGSPQGKYYEERVGIELFTYELLQKLKKDPGVEVSWEEVFYSITGYLKSAIYRMKNNFVLNSQEDPGIEGDIGRRIEEICREDSLLSERLRAEEIRALEEIVERAVEERKRKVISMEELTEIAAKNSEGLRRDTFMADIMERFGEYVEKREGPPLKGLSYYIGYGDVIEAESMDEGLSSLSRGYLEEYIEGGMEAEDLVKSRMIHGDEVECYYFSETSRVKRSGMKVVIAGGRVAIILILKDDQKHLKALSQLKGILEDGDTLRRVLYRGKKSILEYMERYT